MTSANLDNFLSSNKTFQQSFKDGDKVRAHSLEVAPIRTSRCAVLSRSISEFEIYLVSSIEHLDVVNVISRKLVLAIGLLCSLGIV